MKSDEKNEKKIFYKVVRVRTKLTERGVPIKGTESYVSAICGGESEVKYEINKKVKPPAWLGKKGYGLFVFDTLEKAKEFASTCPKYDQVIIFEAETGEELPLPKYLSLLKLMFGKIEPMGGIYPDGTKCVSWVKLKNIVYETQI